MKTNRLPEYTRTRSFYEWRTRRNVLCLELKPRGVCRGWIEYRPLKQAWDVMLPVQYGRQEFPKASERHADLFSAISALRRLDASTR